MRIDRRSRRSGLLALAAVGALALLAPGGAGAQQKKLKVKVETRSQTQALNQGALKVSYKSKGLNQVSATAKATPSGGGQLSFASKDQRSSAKGTLSLRLTGAGRAALSDCASLRVRVQAKGKPKKSAKASRMLSEDDRVCAEPVREFATDSSISYLTGIDAGPDGALWFAQSGAGADSIGRMTTGGAYSSYTVPVPPDAAPGDSGGYPVNDVVTGPDGAIWATPFGNDWVRRIDPATGAVTQFQVPGIGGFGATKIAAGPDDALWITDGGSTIYRLATDGAVTSFPLSDPARPELTVAAYGIAASSDDGAIWFTTPDVNNSFPGGTSMTSVGRLDPATGETQLFPLPVPDDALGYMTADRAGRLWFTNLSGNSIGRIDPDSGQVVEFEVPTANSKPTGIAFADDGSLWFTENMADNIGRYDPASGQFTEYPLEQIGSLPFDITVGDDGKVYFTEMGTGRIGQLDPNKAPTGAPNPGNGRAQPPFGEEGRCEEAEFFLCQQQTSLEGGTFRIGDALTQVLPSEALTLTAGVNPGDPNLLVPPSFGPMLEAKPLDVEVGGQAAVTRIGLSGPPALHQLAPIDVTVPIDLYVAPAFSSEGGCVIGPVVQNLAQIPDEQGDMGLALFADTAMFGGNAKLGPNNTTGSWTGTLADDAFEVPAARGCGPLTPVINNLLQLPSPSGNNETVLPFSMFIIGGPGLAGG
jgi:virginiamycin B lyase